MEFMQSRASCLCRLTKAKPVSSGTGLVLRSAGRLTATHIFKLTTECFMPANS